MTKPTKRPRSCQVCRHPEVKRIEALSLSGVSLDRLAKQFGVSRDSIHRHMTKHVTPEAKVAHLAGPARIAELAEIATAEGRSVLDYLSVLRSVLFAQLDKVSAKGDHYAAATISKALLPVLQTLGRVSGELNSLASATGEMKRQELRAFIRGLEPAERVKLALTDVEVQEAVVFAQPALSGLSPEIHSRVRDTFTQKAAGPQLAALAAEADELEQVVAAVSVASLMLNREAGGAS